MTDTWLVTRDMVDTLMAMSNDTLIKINDALVCEWFEHYNGPRDSRGVMLMDGWNVQGIVPAMVFVDDVSWDGPRDDELGDQVQLFINALLAMRSEQGETK